MLENDCLDVFLADIEKIISGESISSTEYGPYDAEHQELLFLAQLLTKADYTPETGVGKKRLWSNIYKKGELEDDDLDLVAGGVNLDELFDEINKKKDR